MMGRIRDAVSLWGLGGLLRDVPELKAAWEDPLFEHARETGRLVTGSLIYVPWFACIVGYFASYSAVILAEPPILARQALQLFLVMLWVAMAIRLSFGRAVRDRLGFLYASASELWTVVPFDPLRAARLIALKNSIAMLSASKEKSLTSYPTVAIIFMCFGFTVDVMNEALEASNFVLVWLVIGTWLLAGACHAMVSAEAWALQRGYLGMEAFGFQLRELKWMREKISKHPEIKHTLSYIQSEFGAEQLGCVGAFICYGSLGMLSEQAFEGRLGVLPLMAVAGVIVPIATLAAILRRFGRAARARESFNRSIHEFAALIALWREGPDGREPEE